MLARIKNWTARVGMVDRREEIGEALDVGGVVMLDGGLEVRPAGELSGLSVLCTLSFWGGPRILRRTIVAVERLSPNGCKFRIPPFIRKLELA